MEIKRRALSSLLRMSCRMWTNWFVFNDIFCSFMSYKDDVLNDLAIFAILLVCYLFLMLGDFMFTTVTWILLLSVEVLLMVLLSMSFL